MNRDFLDFIKHTDSQKSISLVIAKDEKELNEFLKVLSNTGFEEVSGVRKLLEFITKPGKSYYPIRSKIPKDIYDFVVQYPTGQVQIFEDKSKKLINVTPVYKNVSLVFLITKEALKTVENGGFLLRNNVGMTYQS